MKTYICQWHKRPDGGYTANVFEKTGKTVNYNPVLTYDGNSSESRYRVIKETKKEASKLGWEITELKEVYA